MPQKIQSKIAHLRFPVIVKPAHLGSSIGVARAATLDEVRGALSVIFRLDTHAIVEPFVENLVEYNVAVRRDVKGGVLTSAIERPKAQGELLDFKDKYMRGGGKSKSGGKQPGAISQGMLSLTREINPPLDREMEEKIRRWAAQCYEIVYGTGAPRIDFLCNGTTGELWLNEVNPCPGSFGYFLWEAARQPLLFSELLSALIDEAGVAHRMLQLPPDPTHPEARLFPRGSPEPVPRGFCFGNRICGPEFRPALFGEEHEASGGRGGDQRQSRHDKSGRIAIAMCHRAGGNGTYPTNRSKNALNNPMVEPCSAASVRRRTVEA